MEEEKRWKQRLQSYGRALAALERGAVQAGLRPLNELEEQGLIQGFEFTHELAWNLCRDFLRSRGQQDVHGSRDATRLAFREGLLHQGETWMSMIESRNLSSHTYNIETAKVLVGQILDKYLVLFQDLHTTMTRLSLEDQG